MDNSMFELIHFHGEEYIYPNFIGGPTTGESGSIS